MEGVRALVWHGPGQLSVDELPDPAPAIGLGTPQALVLGELEAVAPPACGPEAFAELAAGPSPRLKACLA